MKILLISFLLFSTNLFANFVGQVILVKGDVSMLLPGERQATAVKKGIKIKEDTSIVTQDKSFVRIKLNDNSVLMVGPKSKTVVVEMKNSQKGVVSLLTGKLRVQVEKAKATSDENKLFIQTRTAAMGVRGTEFQTTYNHQNKITSLVTFKGEVAMAKVKDTPSSIITKDSAIKKLDTILKKNDSVVLVKKGRYAGVSSNLKNATAPVKISPKQFTLLRLNENLEDKAPAISKEKLEQEVEKTKKEFSKLTDNGNGSKSEGTFDAKTEVYKPKSGGLVDLETGVYIPPPKDSKYDEEAKVFVVTKEVGSVDDKGFYQPPKGVILDANKGFVADKESDVKVTVSNLNQNIAGQIVEPKIPKKSNLEGSDEDAYQKYFYIE